MTTFNINSALEIANSTPAVHAEINGNTVECYYRASKGVAFVISEDGIENLAGWKAAEVVTSLKDAIFTVSETVEVAGVVEGPLFVRFTENIEADIEVGTSILTNHNDEVAEGLCAFGPFKTMEEANKCVKFWQDSFPADHEHYAVFTATERFFCKKGSLGTIVRADSIKLITVR